MKQTITRQRGSILRRHKKLYGLILMFLMAGIGLQAQTASWETGYPKLSPSTLTVLDDPGYLDVYFTPTVAAITTPKLEVKLPANIKYESTETGTGHTASITYGTPAVTGTVAAGQTVSITFPNTLNIGEAIFLRIKVSALCGAANGTNAVVKVLANGTVVTSGQLNVLIGVQTPTIRVTSAAPTQNYTLQTDLKEFELSLDAINGQASSFILTLTGDKYTTLSNFTLDGTPITPTSINIVSGTTSATKVTLTTTEMGGKLGTTIKKLKFKAGNTRCGARTITTSVQYPSGSNCSTQNGVSLTMNFPGVAGLPLLQNTSSKWVDTDFTTGLTYSNTDGSLYYGQLVFKNTGSVAAHDMVFPIGPYGFYYYFDLDNIYYSVNGGPRVKATSDKIATTNNLASDVSIGVVYKSQYLGKPNGIRLSIPEVLDPGNEVIIWVGCQGGNINDNASTLNLYYDYWSTVVGGLVCNPTSTNACGEAGSTNAASLRISAETVPHFREFPADLSFRPGDQKTQRIRISAEDIFVSSKKSVEIFFQLPSWLSLDGNIEDAIIWKNLEETVTYPAIAGSGVNHGGGKYSIKFTSISNSNSYLFVKYKAGACPGTTANYDESIQYWINWYTGDGTDPKRVVMERVSQLFQPAHLFCLEDGMVLSDFGLIRTTKGLKDSNNDGNPDDGMIAPDGEINHNYYMLKDKGYIKWSGHIAGTTSNTYTHWYAPVSLKDLIVNTSGSNFTPDLTNAFIKINGVSKNIDFTYVSGKGFYLHYDATSSPLKGTDVIEVQLPFEVTAVRNNASSILSSACFVSNTPVSDLFSLTAVDKLNCHGQDVIGIQIGTFNLDRLSYWNSVSTTIFNDNTPLYGNYGYDDIFHQTKISKPYFKNEVRRHAYISKIVWELPEGYLLPSPLDLDNRQQDVLSTNTKPLSPASQDGNIYTYNVESLFDVAYNGSNSLTSGKWMLPDDQFVIYYKTDIQATRGASIGKSTVKRTSYYKDPATGIETPYTIAVSLDYRGLATVLSLSTTTLPAYGSTMTIPTVSVGNPNSIPLNNVWLYVAGNVSNISITPSGGGAPILGEGNGRWIKVSDLMAVGDVLSYKLDFTYGGSNDCSTVDKVKIYTVSGFENPWVAPTGSDLVLTDYAHVGANKELTITSAPAMVTGSLSVSNPTLVHNTGYALTAVIDSRSSQGALKNPQMKITIPAGQKYVSASAMIEYPLGSAPVAVPAALENALIALNSTAESTITLDMGANFLLPGYLASGTDNDRQVKFTLNFAPQCETELTGIRFNGELFGSSACGDKAKGSGNLVFAQQMFPNITSNYTFEVNSLIVADGNKGKAFNELRSTAIWKVTIKKLTGIADNLASGDFLQVALPKQFNLSGTASVTSGLGVGGVTTQNNTVAGNNRVIALSLPVSAYNSASQKGVGVDVVYEIPVVYTPSGQDLAANPEQSFIATVTTNLQFHSSCTSKPASIGTGSLGIAVLTANSAPYMACLNTSASPEITSIGFDGKWYDNATRTTVLASTPAYTFTPTVQANSTFYVSAGINGVDYGTVPVQVNMNPEATITITPLSAVCAGSNVNLTSAVSGTPAGATIEYFGSDQTTPVATPATVLVNATTTYYVQVTTTAGCKSAKTFIVVTVNPLPDFILLNTTANTCSGTAFDLSSLLSGTPTNGGVMKYYSDAACTTAATNPVATSGTYYLRAENTTTGCKSAVQSVSISLKTPTSISVQPTGGSTCAGTNLTMSVTAAGEGTLTYQWKKDGSAVSGATSSTYATSVAGSYIVEVTGGCGLLGSSAAVITAKAATTITTQPAATKTVCAGVSTTISVSATAEGTPTYQWYDTGGIISGATGSSYTPNSSGTYYVVVTGGCGTTTSTNSLVTINPLPVPTITGASSAAQSQSGVAYSTETGKSNYVWTITGGTITSGQNTSSITVTWGAGVSGSLTVTYQSNGCSPVSPTGKTVTLSTQSVPVITLGSSSVCLNDISTYSTESSKFDYAWTVVGGTIQSGQGTNSVSVKWDGSGASSVKVAYRHGSNPGLPLVDATESITRKASTVITTAPVGGTVCFGNTHAMSTVAGCHGTPTYTWKKDGTTCGTNSASYTATATGNYTVEVAGACGTAISTPVTVTVKSVPTTTVTGTQNVVSTQSVTYTAGAGSNYVWTVTGGTITSGGASGDATATVTWGSGTTGEVKVSCVSGGCPSSEAVLPITISAQGTPVITSPVTSTCLNTAQSYSTTAGKFNYLWTVTGGTISGANNAATVSVTWGAAGTGTIKVAYSDALAATAIESAVTNVTINNIPTIAAIIAPTGVCAGTALTLTPPTVTSTPSVTTEGWKLNNAAFTSGTIVAFAQHGQLLVYEAANACGTVTSNATAITVYQLPTVTTTAQSICPTTSIDLVTTVANPLNHSLSFYTVATGGTALSSSTVTPSATTTYYVESTNSNNCMSATRTPVTITLKTVTAITVQPVAPSVVGIGNPFALTVSAVGENLTYQWYKNGSAIALGTNATAQSATYSVVSTTAADYGNYHVVVTGDCGTAQTSGSVTVNVLSPDATLKDLLVNGVSVPGFSSTITEYTYYADCNINLADIVGIKNHLNATVVPASGWLNQALAVGDNRYTFTVTAENGFTTKTYSINVVRDCYVPRILKDLDDAVICVGDTHTFEIEVEGQGLTYEWYYGLNRIMGANTNSLTISDAVLGDYERYYVVIRSNYNGFKSSAFSKKVRLWVADQLPTHLRFSDYPNPAITGNTYHIKVDGYTDVTKYTWSYDREGLTFSPGADLKWGNEAWATFGTLSAGNGILKVTMEHPCGTRELTLPITVKYPTGTEDVTATIVQVYPNPTSGILKVSGTELNQQIRVLDVTGSLKGTYKTQEGTTTIDLTGYAKGTYMLQYNGKTYKVIKK